MPAERFKQLVHILTQSATRDAVFPSDIIATEKLGIDVTPYLIRLGYGRDKHEVMDTAGEGRIVHVTFITSINAAMKGKW